MQTVCIKAGFRSGCVSVPSSKSYAHRQMICAALSNKKTSITCDGFSKDIIATAGCLQALSAGIEMSGNLISIDPICNTKSETHLPCNESGSTLRFLLPVAAALGADATFEMADGLTARPVDTLLEVMKSHNVIITKGRNTISLKGKMTAGEYSIPGDISSQYVSGLLMALPLLDAESRLIVTGNIESRDYIKITEDVLRQSGIEFTISGNEYIIPGKQQYISKDNTVVEQDWSNAAFFLCMGALSQKGIRIEEMPLDSNQGDREIINVLEKIGADIDFDGSSITVKRNKLKAVTVDASEIPDLVPTIAALASLCEGRTHIKNAGRLRIKESDRLESTSKMLKALGADVVELEDGLIIDGKKELAGGTIDACNDHRIAMAAAVAACGCTEDVFVLGAECIAKSYPKFWEHLEGLEISNEQ